MKSKHFEDYTLNHNGITTNTHMNFNMDEIKFSKDANALIQQCNLADKETKQALYISTFEFLVENKEQFHGLQHNCVLSDVVLGKLLNFQQNAPGFLDTEKYLALLFPTREFIANINVLVTNCNNASEATKPQLCTGLFEYIVANKGIFDICTLTLKNNVLKKLLDYEKYESFDGDRYLKTLFPNYSRFQTLEVKPENVPIKEPELVKVEVKLNDTESLKESPKIVDNELSVPKEDTPFKIVDDELTIYSSVVKPTEETKIVMQSLVFEDYKENKFTGLCLFSDVTLLEKITQNISSRYPTCDTSVVLAMLNDNKTSEQVKADTTYPNGPFLVKLKDNFYELYEKTTEVVVSAGYFYGSKSYANTTVTCIGKYGQVF